MQDLTIVSGSDVADIGVNELVGSQSRDCCGQISARSRSGSRCAGVNRCRIRSLPKSDTVLVPSPLGNELATLGRPISGMGLESSNSLV